jgi:hypothetical protein
MGTGVGRNWLRAQHPSEIYITVLKVHFPALKWPHTIKKIDYFILKKLLAITFKRKK